MFITRYLSGARRSAGLLVCTVLAILALASSADGQCELAKLVASDGAANDEFGSTVSITGDSGNEVAIVGASADDDAGVSSGAAYIYRKSGATWVQEQKLLASDGAPIDLFGYSVSITGTPGHEVAIIGAYADDDLGDASGSAYIFRYNGTTWVQEQKLLASDGAVDDYFGFSVAITGSLGNEVAIVGAYHDDDAGSAYIYRKSGATWVQEQKILAADGAALDFFGRSVSISSDTGNDIALVGAWGDDTSTGSAYIFRYNSAAWVQEQKLLAADGATYDEFGFSVSISGAPGSEVAVVGARDDDDSGSNSGSAYIFRYSGAIWVQEQKLHAPDAEAYDAFGSSVAISGPPGYEVAVIGAYGDDAGSAHTFRFDGETWNHTFKFAPSDGTGGDYFGGAVAAADNNAIVGARVHNLSGSAYIFGGLADCNGNEVLDCQDIFDGTDTDYNGNLVPDTCEAFAYNVNTALSYSTIADAIVNASDGHTILAPPLSFTAEPDIDFRSKAITLTSLSGIGQSAGGLYKLTDDATLVTDWYLVMDGELRADVASSADAHADTLLMNSTGRIVCQPDSYLSVTTASNANISGLMRVHDQATLSFSGPVMASGPLTVYPGGTFIADGAFTFTGAGLGDGGKLTANNGLSLWTGSSLMLSQSDLFVVGDCNVSLGPLTASDSNLFISEGCIVENALTQLGGLMIVGTTVIVTEGGALDLSGGLIYAEVIENDELLNMSGEFHTDITNTANAYCLGDTLVVGTYLNDGTTTVQVGTLTIVGTLTNYGTIIGDVQGGDDDKRGKDKRGAATQVGDGMNISGTFTAGAATSLMMPDPVWTFAVGGDFDVAINDNTTYDMSLAALHLNGLAGSQQALELMSEDIGPDPLGLDRTLPGHYPIHTLRLGGTTVDLVDLHDNDGLGQAACEAIYVHSLIIDAGTTLYTSGCRVYCNEATINGSVDDLNNIIIIDDRCPEDLADPRGVEQQDLNAVLNRWGDPACLPGGAAHPCPEDIVFPDGVEQQDLNAVLNRWGDPACE